MHFLGVMLSFANLILFVSSIFKFLCFPTISFKSLFEGIQDLGDNLDASIVSHDSNSPHLACRWSQTSRYLNQVILHAVSSNCLPVDSLRNLDSCNCWESGVRIRHKEFQSQVSDPSVKMISTEPVTTPGVLKTLLCNDCQTLSQSIH